MDKFTNFVERFLAIVGVVATVVSCYVGVLALRNQEFREQLNPLNLGSAAPTINASAEAELNTAVAVLQQEKAGLQATAAALQQANADSQATTTTLQQANADFQATSTMLQQQNSELQTTTAALQEENDTLALAAQAEPTATPAPRATSTTTPVPTAIPPGFFRDDFERGLAQEWGIIQPGLAIDQGVLSGKDGLIKYTPITNNYRIRTHVDVASMKIFFRAEDDANKQTIEQGYAFSCFAFYGITCQWSRTTDGGSESISSGIPTDVFGGQEPAEMILEVDGRNFTVTVDGEVLTSISDERFQSGSIFIQGVHYPGYDNNAEYDYIQVEPLE